jgi:hypothetical protein
MHLIAAAPGSVFNKITAPTKAASRVSAELGSLD